MKLPRLIGMVPLVTWVVGVCGVLMMWSAARSASWSSPSPLWLVLAITADFFTVELRRYGQGHKNTTTLSIFAIWCVLGLYGHAWGTLVAGTSALIFGIRHQISVTKTAFNIGVVTLSTSLAGVLIFQSGLPLWAGVLAAAPTYFLINTWSVALVLALVTGRPARDIWRESFGWVAVQNMTLTVAGFALGHVAALAGWRAFLIAMPVLMLHYTFRLYARQTDNHLHELELLSEELIATLSAIVDSRDPHTFGHSTHVARYSVAIAEKLGYAPQDLNRIHRSALLHDIGKIGIPEQLLFKPGPLLSEEYESMKQHPVIGYEILRRIHTLGDAASVALHHHERWNGSGYPHGLTGRKIDLDSRIVGVADSIEAMLSDRPYRKGLSLSTVMAELERQAGVLYDPDVIGVLREVVAEKGAAFFVNSGELIRKGEIRPIIERAIWTNHKHD